MCTVVRSFEASAMFYADLTEYSYANVDHRDQRPLAGVLNVGWLERGREVVTGVAPEGVLTGLRRALRLSSATAGR